MGDVARYAPGGLHDGAWYGAAALQLQASVRARLRAARIWRVSVRVINAAHYCMYVPHWAAVQEYAWATHRSLFHPCWICQLL
jgi:hypothetical protein